ncbi:hypothetical protein C0992_001094 [Termitomyces sp. T32_za158]|nr:hypothetical protein C0992_001094 [Termitomyces sp. T32_za158]
MRFCFALTILAAAFATGIAITVEDCRKDSDDVSLRVCALDKAIEDLSNDIIPSQGTAINIENCGINLQRALDKASLDFKATATFSATDSQAILKIVDSYTPSFLRLLANVVAKKEAIARVPFPGILSHVRDALAELHRSNNAFEDAWISSSTTNDVENQARSIKAKIDTAFANAEVAYSS